MASIPEAWLAADTDLRQRLDVLEQAVHTAHADLLRDLRATVQAPLDEAFRDAAAAHRDLMRALNGRTAPASAVDLWQRLCRYRDEGKARILRPLADALAALDPAGTVTGRFRAVHTALAEEAMQAPEEVTRPEPLGLYTALPGDAFSEQWKKASVRFRRASTRQTRQVANTLRRLIGRPGQPLPPHGQTVELRKLLLYFLHVHLPPAQVSMHAQVQQDLAVRVARLEAALTDWTNRLLRLESKLDALRPHTPDALAPDADPLDPALIQEAATLATDLDAFFEPWIPERKQGTPKGEGGVALSAQARRVAEEPDTTGRERREDDAPAFRPMVDDALARLRKEVERADSPLMPRLHLPPQEQRAFPQLLHRGGAFSSWHRQAVNRLRLDAQLLALRRDVQAREDAFIEAAAAVTLNPVRTAFRQAAAALRSLHDEVLPQADALSADALPGALQTWQEQALGLMQTHVEEPLDPQALAEALVQTVTAQAQALAGQLGALPETFRVHPVPPPGIADVNPEPRAFDVELREMAVQAWRGTVEERLRGAAFPLQSKLAEVLAQREQPATILRYNLESAAEEAASGNADAKARARELLDNGLLRAAELLETLALDLAPSLAAFGDTVVKTMLIGWARFHERVQVDDRTTDQLLDLRQRVAEGMRGAGGTAQQHWLRGGQTLRRYFRIGQQRANDLVQRGQSAVGVRALQEEETFRTLDALAGADAFLEQLPLVYRRLFSFQPLLDPDLVEGRQDDLARVQQHIARWQHGLSNAIVIRGRYGSGRTTFLNLVQAAALPGFNVRTVTLTTRVQEETELAAVLGEALGVTADSLESLESHLIATGRPEPPIAVIVEQLEHLMLRVPGGADLLEKTLRLFARTDTLVLWIGTITDPAWQFLVKAQPSLPGLVTVVEMSPLGRADLENAVLHRHRRSGMPLRFEPPPDLSPLARRRFERFRTDEEKQAFLRTDFFDRLYRASGQNLALALFYWLHAVRFSEDVPELAVQPLHPFSFAFLQSLDLSRAFTLRAFLEHETLCLDEHIKIFDATRNESFLIFESLQNLLLIEPADASGSTPVGPVREDVRYRIRPLVIHPVTEFLRSKRIIY